MKKADSAEELREVLLHLYALRIRVSDGGYNDGELAALQKALRWTQKFFGRNPNLFYGSLRVSKAVISNIAQGGRPRLHNFILCLHDLIVLLEKWIREHPEIIPVFSGTPSEWQPLKAAAQKRVSHVIRHLTAVLDIVRRSNSLAMNDDVMPPELRQALIAFLESALAQLRSPMVEKSFMRKMGSWLLSLGKESASEAARDTFKKLASSAGDELLDLLDKAI